jgi:hypothetical protein
MTSLARKLARAAGLALACAAAIALPAQAARPGHAGHAAHARQQIGYSAAAKQVLDRARAAAGGAGWNLLRGWHETGREGGQRYESWFDPLRYGMRVETRGAGGLSVQGYNGQGDWRIRPNGDTVAIDDRAAVARTRTAAFMGASGFFYPGRFDARGESLGVRQSGGRAFDVVKVVPWGGAARELWFDRRTHLLGRVVDRTAPQAVTVEFSDYRRVGPIRVAFHVTVHGPAGVEARDIDAVVFTPADRALFSLPRTGAPPAAP